MGAIQSILQSKYDHDISIHYLLLETVGSFPLQSEVNKMELQSLKKTSNPYLKWHSIVTPYLIISLDQLPNQPQANLIYCDLVEEVKSG